MALAAVVRLYHVTDGERLGRCRASALEVLPNLAYEALCHRDIGADEADGSRARVVEGSQGERRLGRVVATGSSAQK